jgi:hypothetical protein
MLRHLIAIAVLSMLVPTCALAEPTLTLDGRWYQVVDPYRYVEARRFEHGWNRGADVRVVDGRVRSPLAGTVRFAGRVGGRDVVTVATQVDGMAVVLTFTGLDGSTVRTGQRIDVAEEIGRGRSVHIGLYDQARRSHYLPVVGAPVALAAPHDGSMSSAVARRLLDAIDGTAVPSGAAPRAPSAVHANPPAVVGASAVAALIRRRALAPRSETRVSNPSSTVIPRPRPGTGMTFDAATSSPTELDARQAWTPGLAAGGRGTGPARVVTGPAATSSGARSVSAARRSARGAPSGRPGPAAADTGPGATDRTRVRLGTPTPWSRSRATRSHTSGSRPHRRRATIVGSAVPCGRASVLLAALVRRRRRRRRAPVHATPVAPPLPVHLPAAPMRRAWRACTDGSSLVPDSALAWPDRDLGTSLETDHTRGSRAPEHA